LVFFGSFGRKNFVEASLEHFAHSNVPIVPVSAARQLSCDLHPCARSDRKISPRGRLHRKATGIAGVTSVASPRETSGWIGKAAGATSLAQTRNTLQNEGEGERERLNGVPGEDPSLSEKYMYTKNPREAKTESEILVIPRCARIGSRRRRERWNSGRVGTDDDYDDERLDIEFASYLPEEGVPTPSSGAFDLREGSTHSPPGDNPFRQTAAGKSLEQLPFITGACSRARGRFIAND